MADDFDPTRRSTTPGDASQGGMDPEGLMPADPELHDEADRASSATNTGQAAADALTSPHHQPVEGGVEEAEDDPIRRR